jgi:putative endonuclease
MARKQQIGRWGEELTAKFLQDKGYEIIGRNERTPYGELDLIARISDLVVFIEVKTRFSESFGLPEISVNQSKTRHILDSVQFYLQNHPEMDCAWRVDVIAIRRTVGGIPPEIVVFENALS